MRNLNFIFGILAMAAVSMAAGCSSFGANAPNSSGFLSDGGSESGGRGGSMARFTIAGDYLYTVNDYELTVVSLADPARPVDVQRIHLGMSGVETIFPMDSLLFIGSQGAMFIYDISRP
ncbi:MAG: hypothetical protein LBU97_04905, partial [Alistipes sp.]|nr:hypothetical protein [Alistipes sp.]